MQSVNSAAKKPHRQAEPQILLKRIGSADYKVAVHFSKTSKETVGDKIVRLIKSEVENQ